MPSRALQSFGAQTPRACVENRSPFQDLSEWRGPLSLSTKCTMFEAVTALVGDHGHDFGARAAKLVKGMEEKGSNGNMLFSTLNQDFS